MKMSATAESASRLRIWFVLFGGGVAWTAHLLLAYALAEFGCIAGLGHRSGPMGISELSWALLGVSALMVALAVWALVISFALRRLHDDAAETDEGLTAGYIARFGVVTNSVFLLVILVQSLPIFFYLGQC